MNPEIKSALARCEENLTELLAALEEIRADRPVLYQSYLTRLQTLHKQKIQELQRAARPARYPGSFAG